MNNVVAFKEVIANYFETYPKLKKGFNRFVVNQNENNLIITVNVGEKTSLITVENIVEGTKKCYYFAPDKVMQYIDFEHVSNDLSHMSYVNIYNDENETLVSSSGALLVTDSSLSCQNRIKFFMENFITDSLSDTLIAMEAIDGFELAAYQYDVPHKMESDLLSQIETERKNTDVRISEHNFGR